MCNSTRCSRKTMQFCIHLCSPAYNIVHSVLSQSVLSGIGFSTLMPCCSVLICDHPIAFGFVRQYVASPCASCFRQWQTNFLSHHGPFLAAPYCFSCFATTCCIGRHDARFRATRCCLRPHRYTYMASEGSHSLKPELVTCALPQRGSTYTVDVKATNSHPCT